MPKAQEFQKLSAPWDRIFSLGTRTFVWGLLIGIIYILQPFFLLIFLTFVFAYVQEHGSEALRNRIQSRILRVILVFVLLLGAIVGTGYFVGPKLQDQVDDLLTNYQTYLKDADKAVHKFAADKPWLKDLLELQQRTSAKAPGEATGPGGNGKRDHEDNSQDPDSQPQEKQAPILQPLIAAMLGEKSKEPKDSLKNAIDRLTRAIGVVWGIVTSFFLSLLFSFLIVLDLPRLTRQTTGLANTKIGFIYSEVAENIRDFGKVVGRALEAQLFIAITNTILTGIGIYFMGLPALAFLCTIVFFCSFIPVAGVFISSVPICLVALQQSGIGLMLIAIGLILLIHFIEAYFLNPKIYGHHLRMNAVLVLIILTVGGTLFGVWGLVLGLPIMNYIFRQAIHRPEDFGLTPG